MILESKNRKNKGFDKIYSSNKLQRLIKNLKTFPISIFNKKSGFTDNELKERIKLFFSNLFDSSDEDNTVNVKSQYIQFIPAKSGAIILLRVADHDVGHQQNLKNGEEIESDKWISLYFVKGGRDIDVEFGRYPAPGFRDDTEKIQYEINGLHLFKPNDVKRLVNSLIELFETGDFNMPFKGYKPDDVYESKQNKPMKSLQRHLIDAELDRNLEEVNKLVMAAIIKAEKEIAKYKAEQKNKK